MVYGNGSWFRPVVDAIRDGSYRYIEDGANAWSFVSLPDTGAGFVRVAESGAPGEVYNLVDGHPAEWRAFGNEVAARLSVTPPASMSLHDAITQFGPDVAHHFHARRACSSAKLERLGWKPQYADYRAGLAPLLREMTSPRRVSR
jgi:nucleoside-diphosphate-sugar epimerase